MARAIAAGELTKLRADGQKSNLVLLFPKPTSVYTARVNQATFTDPLVQVTYDGGSGTLADVKTGMTMYIGSSAGAYDKGIARIRKTPTASIFYIGESSDIAFADDDYLTIVNEFRLWPKHLTVSDEYVLMDYDDAYTDEHDDPNPTPVIGPHAAVKLAGATVAHQRDGSGSWSLGTSVSSHAWTAGGPATVTIDSMGAADPTFTFSTAGYHLIEDTVTSANGKTKTGYRVTYVYDSTNRVDDFQLKECYGDHEEGGWSFTVRMFDDAANSDVVDRAMVMLVAEEEYADTAGSIGPLANYENLVCVGHIDGESITRDPNNASEVEFTIRGPHYWLQEIPGFPVGIENTGSTATAWTNFEDMTVDDALWHLLEWRSTATAVMDIPNLTSDTKNLPTAEAPGNQTLWDQLYKIAWETIFARPLCDRYGRLYIEPETQIVPSADRSGFPTVQTVTDNDWGGKINIERQPRRRTSLIDMSGISYDGSTATPLISKAMGVVYALYGRTLTVDSLLLASQAQLNTLSGDYFAWENNEYPHVDINLAQNNRFFDITPRQYAVLNLAAANTPREVTWSSKKFIPRRVELNYDPGMMQTYLELEAETTGTDGQTVQYIPPPQYGLLPDDFKIPTITLPPLGPGPNIFFPDPVPTDPQLPPETGATCPDDAEANGPFPLFGSGTLDGTGKYWIACPIQAVIRTADHDNRTSYEIRARFQEKTAGVWGDVDTTTWYGVYAYYNKTLVATGVHDAVTNSYLRTGTLDASPDATEINYIYLTVGNDQLRFPSLSVNTQTQLAWAVNTGTVHSYPLGAGWVVNASGYTFTGAGQSDINIYLSWTDYASHYAGRTFTISQIGTSTATAAAIQWLYGGHYNGAGDWAHDVGEDYNPSPYPAAAGWDPDEQTFTKDATKRPALLERAGYAFAPSATYTLNSIWTIFLDAKYRIILEKMNLYNVCPVEA